MPFVRTDGRPNVAVPLPRAAVRAGPPHPRAVRAGPDMTLHKLLLKLRLVAQRRPAWRPLVARGRPISTRRPREGGARMVAVGGRDGNGERDDGSGGDSDSGGGGGSDASSRLGARVFERERGRATL